jgi:hypothetical protein
MMAQHRLKLVPDRWYGWQMIPGYGGERNVPYFSPIRISRVTPKKSGNRVVNVSFWNVLYAQGVQNFQLDLRILARKPDYLIAEILYGESGPADRCAVISHIEFEWIHRMCPGIWSARPPESMGPLAQGSVSIYLNEVFPH